MGCEAAITKGFAKLQLNADDYDSSSSDDDSDDFLSKPRFSSPMPKQQRTSTFQLETYQPFPTSSNQAMNETKQRRKERKDEEDKKEGEEI